MTYVETALHRGAGRNDDWESTRKAATFYCEKYELMCFGRTGSRD